LTANALYIRRMWNFSKALDLALIDDEIEKGFKVPLGQRHGERVGYIALNCGKSLGLSREELSLLLVAGLMHDIGAVGGFALYHGDPRLVREHCLVGADIVRRFPNGDILSEAILHHHETPDPTHSVLGVDGSNISLMAKVLSLADKVDVHLSRRLPNHSERNELIQWIKSHEGSLFFSEVLPAFLEVANRESFWLDLDQPDLLQVSLSSIFDLCNLPISQSIDNQYIQELALTFADLIDQKSAFTATHSRSVANVAEQLALGLGWEKKEVNEIRVASLLHDLGKLAVPKKVLDKPGKLDVDEFSYIRTHTYYTYRLLDGAGFPIHIVNWAAFHHERLDGQGYPFGKKAEELDVGARLMTIADIYAALTEERPYRKPLTPGQALEIIARGSGTQVDPKLLELAQKILI
jgi:putative nucleotidyltransferase with HDIG domain